VAPALAGRLHDLEASLMLAKVGWAQRTSSGPFNADALSSAGAATKTPSAAAGAKGKASAAGAGVPSTTNVVRHTYTPRLCQTTTTGGGCGGGGGKLAAFVRDELSLMLEVRDARLFLKKPFNEIASSAHREEDRFVVATRGSRRKEHDDRFVLIREGGAAHESRRT
jgi:hypothetical protein